MRLPFRMTFWRAVLGLIWIAGAISIFVRFTQGIGAASNLSDKFPWGLWIGFDVVTGVGLAAGGFTIAATVYVFHIKKFYPVLRPAILTAFLGYLLVIVALLIDIGRPDRIYHPLLMGNPRSVMFEVAMCVMFYASVLALEFSPVVFERFNLKKPLLWIGKISVPLVIAGVVLSFLHQSSLGSLYLIMPSKLYPLWYSPLLPLFFLVSAISVGCAMVIFESHLSCKSLGHHLEMHILRDIGRVLLVLLGCYLVLKMVDLNARGIWHLVVDMRYETYLYWLEMGVGVIAPIVLLSIKKYRLSPNGLFIASVLTTTGFLLNRMNVTITGMEAAAGMIYIPSWMEVSISVAVVATLFFLFAIAVRYLPVFGNPKMAERGIKNGRRQLTKEPVSQHEVDVYGRV